MYETLPDTVAELPNYTEPGLISSTKETQDKVGTFSFISVVNLQNVLVQRVNCIRGPFMCVCLIACWDLCSFIESW